MNWIIKNTSIILLFAAVFSGNGLAKPSERETQCTQAELDKIRKNDYQKLFKQEKFKKAAQLLNDYLIKKDCWTALIFEQEDQGKQDSYAWALRDVALAHSKAGNHVACIQLMETPISGTNGDVIVFAENSEIKKAFEANKDTCQKNRLINFQPDQLPKCTLPILNQSIQVAVVNSDSKKSTKTKNKISSILESFQLSNQRCVAQVTVELTQGPNKDQVPFLVEANTRKDHLVMKVLKSLNDPLVGEHSCWSSHQMTLLKDSADVHFLRLVGQWKNCYEEAYAGGKYDSLFKIGNEIKQEDEITTQSE